MPGKSAKSIKGFKFYSNLKTLSRYIPQDKNKKQILIKYCKNLGFTCVEKIEDLAMLINESIPHNGNPVTLINSSNPERLYHEGIPANIPIKMFGDIDGEIPYGRSRFYEFEVIGFFLESLRKFMELKKIKYNLKDFKWLTSSKDDKLSLHFVNNEVIFNDIQSQKAFWEEYAEYQHENYSCLDYLYLTKDKQIDIRSIIDLSVYSANKFLRCIYCSKNGDKRILKPYDIGREKIIEGKVNILDYFINITEDKLNKIEEEKQEKIKIKKKKNKKYSYAKYKVDEVSELIQKLIDNGTIPDVTFKCFNGKVFELRNIGLRKCLVSEGDEHKSNNAYCYVTKSFNKLNIYYACHSSRCKDKKPKLIYSQNKNQNFIDYPVIDKMDKFDWNMFVDYFSSKIFDSFEDLVSELIQHTKRVLIYVRFRTGFYIKKDDYFEEDNDDYREDELFTQNEDFKGLNDFNLRYKKKECKKPTCIPFAKFIKKYDNLKIVPTYNKIICNPSKNVKSKYFNVWKGFKAKELESFEKSKIEGILNYIYEVLADSNQDVYDYIIKIMAKSYQYPNKPAEGSLLLYGLPGSGKSTICDFLKIVNGMHAVSEMNSIDQCTGTFNGHLLGAKLVIVNEIADRTGNANDNFDKIKHYITDQHLPIRQMQKDLYTAPNMTFWIFISNHKYFKLDKFDRRYLCCEVSSKYMNDKDGYFTKLRKKYFNLESASHFYTFLLKGVDLTDFNPDKIPMTKLKKELTESSQNSAEKFLRFIKDWYENKDEKKNSDDDEDDDEYNMVADYIRNKKYILKTKIWELYKKYCKYAEVRHKFTRDIFYNRINDKFDSEEPKKRNIGLCYNIEFIDV